MKNKKLMIRTVVLFAFFALTNIGFSQITTEEDMARAVFETIKNSDLETFSSYLVTDEKMANMLKGMEESTPKEKGVKQDLKEENATSIRKECINGFKALIEELNTKSIAIDKGVFSDFTTKVRVEVPNCKAITIEFVSTFDDKIHYQIRVDVFKTESDLFIFNFHAKDLYDHKP